jgi:hypothetical protein
MRKFKPGEPERKAQELRAAIADKTMTEAEAIDALATWAEEVGLKITRQGAGSMIHPHSLRKDPR